MWYVPAWQQCMSYKDPYLNESAKVRGLVRKLTCVLDMDMQLKSVLMT
jgi:hypothetical protein